MERALAALPPPTKGEPGKDADPEFIRSEIAKSFAALPAPKGPDPETVRLCVAELLPSLIDKAQFALSDRLEKAIAGIREPTDGKSITLDEVRPLLEAEVSRIALDFERRAGDVLQRAIENIPKPKDGTDGYGFDDLQFEHDGARNAVLRFVRGDQVKEFAFRIPAFIDCGTYKAGQAYEKGDGVTYGGSFFIAQCDTVKAPETGPDWRLACKRGRDAKT